VVRAVAASTIPIISAVGHETDTSLCDFAADVRAPTPTAAAEIAVPVRAELLATLADFAHRKRRCALRPVELGRERLTARVQRMPRAEALLAPQAQKLDELAERLRRGLKDRAAAARERLQGDSARLSAPLLRTRLERAGERLAAVRLNPLQVTRPLAERRERLAAIARLAEQLHPDRPLQRGYVRVTDAAGLTLTEAAAAKREPALTLRFRDGTLEVAPASGAQRKPRPVAPAQRPHPSAAQDDLFG
jgi:exodeoxyribonuclease VII large subunit